MFWQWFAWKYNNVSGSEQEKVIGYFTDINNVFEQAMNTRHATQESELGSPDIARAIDIIKESLRVAREIKPPKFCQRHYKLTIGMLRCLKSYQINRLKFREGQEFENKTKNIISILLLDEASRNKEYFIILRKIGFFDNCVREMFDLKLITSEEKLDFEEKLLGRVPGENSGENPGELMGKIVR